MKHITKSLTLVLALALCASAFAHDKHDHKAAKTATAKSKFLGKGDGVTTCPVTGEKFENKDNKAVFFGRTVYFCCADCLAAAKKNPAAYIKRTQKEQLIAIKNASPVAPAEAHDHHAMADSQDAAKGEKKFLGKGDGIDTCPVMGEPVNKNLKYEVNGRTFYVCCEGCAEVVKKNPDLYLKPVQSEKGEKKEQKKEGNQEQAFLGKGDGIDTCPVTGEAVNKELKGEVDGQTFYVCCAGCIDTVKKNPTAYLKKAAK